MRPFWFTSGPLSLQFQNFQGRATGVAGKRRVVVGGGRAAVGGRDAWSPELRSLDLSELHVPRRQVDF